tara:strand:- start:2048 stop:2242 length:195 start_codon:yes stop_codon:yes gene_type:complete
MKIQTLAELEQSIGGRPKKALRKKKVRLSFYLDIREAQLLNEYAEIHDKTISKVVRELLKLLLK